MYTDMFGKKRVKLALHQHSTRSDGSATPEEIVRLYKAAGYDAVALTDHWVENPAEKIDGMPILAGCEYHVIKPEGGEMIHDSTNEVHHIVALCCDTLPALEQDLHMPPQEIVDAIHAAGGLAILAHPAWSFNTPEQIASLHDVDAVEIYNSFSNTGNNRRPDSSLLIDQTASRYGTLLAISGADDSHAYTIPRGKALDYCKTFVMAECESTDPEEIKKAMRERRFYTSQGPEIHLTRQGNRFTVDCSPCIEIAFFSNLVVSSGAVKEGENLTHYEFETPQSGLKFVRAMVTDANGNMAWSQYIKV